MSFLKKIIFRFLMMVGLLTIVMAISAIFILKNVISMRKSIDEDTLLHLNVSAISGDVTTDSGFFAFENMFSNRVSLIDTLQLIENAAEDENITGIFADVSSVPLSFSQVEELRNAIEKFKKSGKPAYAWGDSFGEIENGTRHYYLASVFDKIYTQPSGMLGLNGLSSSSIFFKGALEKLEIEPIGSKREEYKTYWNMFTEEKYTKEHEEAVTGVLDSIFNKIASDISVSRNISKEKVYKIGDSMPLTAEKSMKYGLIDGIKYREQVLEALKTETGYKKRTSVGYYRDVVFSETRKIESKIALIELPGTIHRGASDIGPSGYHQSSGSSTITGMIRRAVKDENVKGIILRVNSPGGSVVASETIWNEIKEIVKENKKPIIVSMGSVAASGGYYVSMSAEKIFANDCTITGSIGVIMGKFYMRDFFKKLGITFDAVSTGKNTRIYSPMTKLDDIQKEYLEKSLDNIYETFVKRAADGRKMEYSEMEKNAKGRVWTGTDAKKRNLVDETGGFMEALSYIKNRFPDIEEFAVVKYPRPERVLAILLGRDDIAYEQERFSSRFIRNINGLASFYLQLQRSMFLKDDELLRLEDKRIPVK